MSCVARLVLRRDCWDWEGLNGLEVVVVVVDDVVKREGRDNKDLAPVTRAPNLVVPSPEPNAAGTDTVVVVDDDGGGWMDWGCGAARDGS